MKRLDALHKEGQVDYRIREGKGSPKEWFITIKQIEYPLPELEIEVNS
jgi:hypothetical protein